MKKLELRRKNIKRTSDLLEISRSSYYSYKNKKISKRSLEEQRLKEEIREIWVLNEKKYGSPKIQGELRKKGMKVSERRIQKLMKEMGIKSVVTQKYKYKASVATEYEGLENRLNRDFNSTKSYEKIVGDITYIRTKDKGWCYLASYMDLYNNEILSYEFGEKMEEELVLKSLFKLPLKKLKGSIIHTDRGSQYTARNYRKKLLEYGIIESYSRRGNPYDNACIESFHSVLKKELIYPQELKSYSELKRILFEYIEGFYNTRRTQKRLGYLSPKEYLKKIS
jgi:putative transposase